MQVQPYLDFNGRCEEALEFYRTKLGAEVTMLMRVEESPDPVPGWMIAAGSEKKIMPLSLLLAGRGRAAKGRPAARYGPTGIVGGRTG